jgi:hypothetical protein
VAENTGSAVAREEQETERVREKARWRIAAILIGALVVIVVGTFVYVIWMSARIAEMTTDDLISVLQSIGTTLLAPLIGVIGAVIGFYFGGQAAVQVCERSTGTIRLRTKFTRGFDSRIPGSRRQGKTLLSLPMIC